MLTKKVKMSNENEIKLLIENSKIGKQLKEKLIAFAIQKDMEFGSLQNDICKLKNEHTEKSLSFEQRLVELRSDDCTCEKSPSLDKKYTALEQKISDLQSSFIQFKQEFSTKCEEFQTKFLTYADAVRLNRPAEFFTDISTKLNLVSEKIEAQSEEKLKQKKALNVIVFNIPESESPNSSLENSKRDLKTIQEVLGENKIIKSELNSLYRIGKINKDRRRPIIIKLNNSKAKQRLLKLRNLKVNSKGNENPVYINPDRTASELLAFKKLREELKIKQQLADEKHLKIQYVIRNNKIVEKIQQPFRYTTLELWG